MTDTNETQPSYILVAIDGAVLAPMSTVLEVLEAAGVPFMRWTTCNLEWILRDAKSSIRQLQHVVEALSELVGEET